MKVVVAMDAFKGTITSVPAGKAVREGILNAMPDADVKVFPLADGGEGTTIALVRGMGGTLEEVTVTGPVGDPIQTTYGIIPESKTAVIEMAAAAGLSKMDRDQRNPLYTTTYGVGELILEAIGKGCKRILIGLGGSATNDGGIGMLQALGFGFLDENGKQVPLGAQGLRELKSIDTDHVIDSVYDTEFIIMSNVSNPLLGLDGCSAVYGPKKGASLDLIKKMDQWLLNYVVLTKQHFPDADPYADGAGAAGGMGFALLNYLYGKMERGVSIVMHETGMEKAVKHADIVVTGEGRLDTKTIKGKASAGVSELAKKYKKPCIAFAGAVAGDAKVLNQHGIDAYFPILRRVVSLGEAMDFMTTKSNLTNTAEQVFRLIGAIK